MNENEKLKLYSGRVRDNEPLAVLQLGGEIKSAEDLDALLTASKAARKVGPNLLMVFDAFWWFSPPITLALLFVTALWSGEIRVVASRSHQQLLQPLLDVPPQNFFEDFDAAVQSLPMVAATEAAAAKPIPGINRINRIAGHG